MLPPFLFFSFTNIFFNFCYTYCNKTTPLLVNLYGAYKVFNPSPNYFSVPLQACLVEVAETKQHGGVQLFHHMQNRTEKVS